MAIELPEHLKSGPLAEAAARALADANSMAATSNSVPRLSLRGREFRLIESGEESMRFRDNLDVIIFGVEPELGRMIKTFYLKGYQSGSKEPPTCSSEDGVAPAPWVTDKQSMTCAKCPKNVFGSATSPSGKPTKACRDSKRAWFVLAEGNVPAGSKDPVKLPPISERTMYGLNVTVASLKAFSEYGKELSALGQGPAVCVTRLKMLDLEYPQLEFETVAWLSATDAPQSLKISASRPWKVKYANAGLALAAPDGGDAPRANLPMTAGPVPSHLRQNTEVVDAQVVVSAEQSTRQVPNSEIDKAVDNW